MPNALLSRALQQERWQRWKRRSTVFLLLQAVLWLVVTPVLVSFLEGWSWTASLYFSVQSGLAIGFGALHVQQDLTMCVIAVQMILGAVTVAGVLGYFISHQIDTFFPPVTESSRPMTEMELTLPNIRWFRLFVAVVLMIMSLFTGVLYGMVWEKWDFVRSLLFAISAAHTSGIVAPTICAYENRLEHVLVVAYILMAVPLMATVTGFAAQVILDEYLRHKKIISACGREKAAEKAFVTAHHELGLPEPDADGVKQVNQYGFYVLWLLRNNLLHIDTIADVNSEFELLQVKDEVALPVLRQRLNFLQRVERGSVSADQWSPRRESDDSLTEEPTSCGHCFSVH